MNDPYDPQEPEERRRGSQYVSRKDVRVISIVLIFLTLLGWPVYLYMLGSVNTSLCSKNLRKIGIALQNYVNDFDDHLPFAYVNEGYGSNEIALNKGLATTWQWQLFRYTGDWKSFRCPAADPSEDTFISDGGGKIESSSYGMLNAYSGVTYSTIQNPELKVIVSETTKEGRNGTFDPLPLLAGGKKLGDDGFLIGFDNDQDYPNLLTKSATRLAFPDSSKTGFDRDTSGRHRDGVHFLTVAGNMRSGDGSAALVIPHGGSFGSWDVPKPAP